MFNVIRMNWYRLWNTTSMLIILFIATIGFAVFSGVAECTDVEMMQEEQQSAVLNIAVGDSDMNVGGVGGEMGDFGLYVNTPYSDGDSPAEFLRFFMADVSAGMPLLFICIAVVLFVNNEEKTGFIKNISGQVRRKSSIYFGKLVVIAAYILILMLVYGVAQYISLQIGFHGDMKFGTNIFVPFIKAFAVAYLLYLAFAGGLMMLTAVLRNNTIGIVVGLLSVCGIGSMLFGLIDNILKKMIDMDLTKYSTAKYSVTGCIRELGTLLTNESGVMGRMLVVGIAFLIVYNVIGNIIFVKRDVV